MQFNPGIGGSITATTLENQFYTIVGHIQAIERDQVQNSNEANIVNSTLDQDAFLCSGNCAIYVYHEWNSAMSVFSYPNPYLETQWTEGESGDGNATNYNHALAERALLLIKAERNATNNPTATPLRFTGIRWEYLDSVINSPIPHNCLLNFSFELNIENINNGDGSTFKAKEYLQG